MEYVEGRSGAQLLQARGSLGPAVAVEIGTQACAGLDYAHRQGIIHRDVKPGNLMVIGGPATRGDGRATAHEPPTGEMTVKLTDFGIARAAEQSRLTQVGSVVGTAAYLAPEQARGEEATPASDVYALGVVIYQLLTGRLPWEGATLAELALRRENERPLPPTSYDADVPETLSTAVLRSLDGDPAGRYSTPRQLAAALRAGGAGDEPPPPDGAVTHATRMMSGEATDATRHLPAEPVTPATRPAAPRRAAPRPRPAARQPRRSAAKRIRNAIGILLVIAILAAMVAGIVLLTTNAGQNTDLVKHDIPDQIQSIKDFINSHTQ
jgi:serine/threonine-protein kinase